MGIGRLRRLSAAHVQTLNKTKQILIYKPKPTSNMTAFNVGLLHTNSTNPVNDHMCNHIAERKYFTYFRSHNCGEFWLFTYNSSNQFTLHLESIFFKMWHKLTFSASRTMQRTHALLLEEPLCLSLASGCRIISALPPPGGREDSTWSPSTSQRVSPTGLAPCPRYHFRARKTAPCSSPC